MYKLVSCSTALQSAQRHKCPVSMQLSTSHKKHIQYHLRKTKYQSVLGLHRSFRSGLYLDNVKRVDYNC